MLDDVEKELVRRIQSGEQVDGLKVNQKFSRESWLDHAEAVIQGKETKEKFYKKALITPKQAVKAGLITEQEKEQLAVIKAKNEFTIKFIGGKK